MEYRWAVGEGQRSPNPPKISQEVEIDYNATPLACHMKG